MATKTTFDFNNENITSGVQKIFYSIQESKVTVSSVSGKEWLTIPLIFALLIGLIFPFVAIIALGLILLRIIKVSIVREVQNRIDTQKTIDSK
ncbi:hypothetical protein [Sphingobacterium paucimobilis]|uniref:DUF4342 domain-containing protein n=1 Tax=Sphingobacterium paucimobilis HER1398 TaxID=1346330 RepID=U2IX38_9SPHI|nr:hypothetical protein [Sphingobacterium paucimobilis]ERJ57264.1 hypothetical protein M472_00645 [Sphingobacterium paucimobilis HER1398]